MKLYREMGFNNPAVLSECWTGGRILHWVPYKADNNNSNKEFKLSEKNSKLISNFFLWPLEFFILSKLLFSNPKLKVENHGTSRLSTLGLLELGFF